MDINQYRIGELAEKAGVTKRTVHYYLAKGLLPPPEGAGLGTTYNDEHLFRIRLIKKMQDNYLPLNEISKRLGVMTIEEVRECLSDDTKLSSYELGSRSLKMVEIGTAYKRVTLKFGVEVYFPSESIEAEDFVEKIMEYAKKIMKEG